MDYNNKSYELHEAGFCVYGVGNFNLNQEEVGVLLEILVEGGNISNYYNELYEKRMG